MVCTHKGYIYFGFQMTSYLYHKGNYHYVNNTLNHDQPIFFILWDHYVNYTLHQPIFFILSNHYVNYTLNQPVLFILSNRYVNYSLNQPIFFMLSNHYVDNTLNQPIFLMDCHGSIYNFRRNFIPNHHQRFSISISI